MTATIKREIWVDNIKIIACIFVALGHFFQSMRESGIMADNYLYGWFNATIYMFHVPLFFICSGYLYQRYTVIDGISSWVKNVLRKLISLGVPYFIFSFATWILKSVFSGSVNTEAVELTEGLFIEPMSPYWYLYALFFVFVITPTARSRYIAVAELMIALVLKMMYIECTAPGIKMISYIMNYGVWFVAGMNMAIFDIPDIMSRKVQKILGGSLITVFVILSVPAYLANKDGWISFALGSIACIGIVEIMIGMFKDKCQSKLLETVARYTMSVFLMHTIFAAGIRVVLMKFDIDSLAIHTVFGLTASFIGPIIMEEIIHTIRGLDFILYPTKYIKIK